MCNRLVPVLWVLAALVPLSGCTGSSLPTVPVTGTVTYNGSPLEGATVSFIVKDSQDESARGASGTTDSQGVFRLQTLVSGNTTVAGALPGDYAVMVSKREDFTPRLREAMAGGDGGDARKLMEEAAKEGDQGSGPRPGPPPGGPPGRPGGGGPPMGMPGTMIGKLLIPEKYADPRTSELTATVKPSGNEPFKFELND